MDDPPRLFDPRAEVEKRQGAYLPHWTQEGCTYFVTFRLNDSLPVEKVKYWKAERKRLELRCAAKNIPESEYRRLKKELTREYHVHLDKGLGECILRLPDIAGLVQDSLLYFDAQRYRLWAWCIMPNHVHAVVQPLAEWKMGKILGAWRSFTAHKINRLLQRSGSIWQQEPFDHLIRSQASLEWCMDYTFNNPDAAKLGEWPWRGKKSFEWRDQEKA